MSFVFDIAAAQQISTLGKYNQKMFKIEMLLSKKRKLKKY